MNVSSESFVLVICLLKLLQKKKTIFLLCSLREEGAAAGSTKKEGKLHRRSLRNWKYIEKNATAWQRKRKKVYENNLLLVHTAVLAERTPRYHRVFCNLWLFLYLAQLLNHNKCYSKEYRTSLKISKPLLPNASYKRLVNFKRTYCYPRILPKKQKIRSWYC